MDSEDTPFKTREYTVEVGYEWYEEEVIGRRANIPLRKIRFVGRFAASTIQQEFDNHRQRWWSMIKTLYEIPAQTGSRWVVKIHIDPLPSPLSAAYAIPIERRLVEATLSDLAPLGIFGDLAHKAGLEPETLDLEEGLQWVRRWMDPMPQATLSEIINAYRNDAAYGSHNPDEDSGDRNE